ncbi:flagellar hook-length control protein FliK [Sphingomonas floccifaciens]|uniref:Flagellar hook-length control protein FliK n=1 Tax=Sphingomonas floccifaciens TaxID=1844115 RepID=A0ABW4NBD0_9SPHN
MIELTALPLSPALSPSRPAGLALSTTSDFALALADLAGGGASPMLSDAGIMKTSIAVAAGQTAAAPGNILPIATPTTLPAPARPAVTVATSEAVATEASTPKSSSGETVLPPDPATTKLARARARRVLAAVPDPRIAAASAGRSADPADIAHVDRPSDDDTATSGQKDGSAQNLPQPEALAATPPPPAPIIVDSPAPLPATAKIRAATPITVADVPVAPGVARGTSAGAPNPQVMPAQTAVADAGVRSSPAVAAAAPGVDAPTDRATVRLAAAIVAAPGVAASQPRPVEASAHGPSTGAAASMTLPPDRSQALRFTTSAPTASDQLSRLGADTVRPATVAVERPAPAVPIASATSPIVQAVDPASQPQAGSQSEIAIAAPATGTRAESHHRTATPEQPAPAIQMPAIAPRDIQPAARMFAQAMFAAAPPVDRDEPSSEALPIALLGGTAPTQLATTPLAVHASAAADQAALDMSRADWMTSMIDRIETIRDESGGVAETRMKLSPDALGNIDVALRRDDAGQIRVDITADTTQARTILNDAAPRLADMAEARGLKLGGATVDTGGSFADSGRRDAQQAPTATPRRPASAATDTSAATSDSTETRLA